MVVLLARLHLSGFLWGDVSLSNTLFRRDAGAFAAYLVDAETGELHDELSDGQREHDLTIARTNLFGEFCDLEAGGLLDASLDPLQAGGGHREPLSRAVGRAHRRGGVRRQRDAPDRVPGPSAQRPRLRRGRARHHHLLRRLDHPDPAEGRRRGSPPRRLLRLTGLDTEENQARRLLNDLDYYRARTDQQNADEAIVAHQWLTERFEPVVNSVPHEMRGKLEPAELYHEVLEHRWYLSERAGQEVDAYDAAQSYISSVLHRLPDEAVAVSTEETLVGLANPFDPSMGFADGTDDKPYDPWEDSDEGPGGTRSRTPPTSTSPPCGPARASRRYGTERRAQRGGIRSAPSSRITSR